MSSEDPSSACGNDSGQTSADIIIEALEVFFNHILFIRAVYPTQIFKKRRIYNTPVHASVFPPLNAYIFNVLKTARVLLQKNELHAVDLVLYRDEGHLLEKYEFSFKTIAGKPNCSDQAVNDEFLLEFEEQLRSSLYKLAERVKILPKLNPDTKFKVLLHTSQSGSVHISHNPHLQEFPWLNEPLPKNPEGGQIYLLPLTKVNRLGLQIMADVYS